MEDTVNHLRDIIHFYSPFRVEQLGHPEKPLISYGLGVLFVEGEYKMIRMEFLYITRVPYGGRLTRIEVWLARFQNLIKSHVMRKIFS